MDKLYVYCTEALFFLCDSKDTTSGIYDSYDQYTVNNSQICDRSQCTLIKTKTFIFSLEGCRLVGAAFNEKNIKL